MSRLIKLADWSGTKRGNVVFVHGLGGHPYETWRHVRIDGSLWPLWLAEEVKGLSVYSLGYVSPPTNWIGTAMPLLDEAAHALRLLLNADELRDGPISFVCHSLGGLIVKQVLRAANEQRGDPQIANFVARVRQVIFIATPHTGSGKATLLQKLSFWAWGSDSAHDLVANKPELRHLNFAYRDFAKARGDQLSHLSYYEMVDTVVGRIVQPDSADPGLLNCTPTPIREDHITIAKLRRRDDLIYAETKTLISSLATESAEPGQLRTYPLEPFKMERSWTQLVPKLVRIAAIVLVAAGLWLGVPRLLAVYSAIFGTHAEVKQTKSKVEETRSDIAEVLRIVSQKESVPLETLRAILKEMGTVATTADVEEIRRLLTAKAAEFNALTERLNRLSNADPEVMRLRLSAVAALKQGHFAEADSDLAAAEARELAGLGDLEAIAKKKRLSAAGTRAERAAAAMLRTNPDAYREAAAHYAEAARIAVAADSKVARVYTGKQGQTLVALGDEFGQNPTLLEAIDHFRTMLAAVELTGEPLEWALTQNNLGNALFTLGARESGTRKLEEAVAAYREALKEWTRERVPLGWAGAQNNLGIALMMLGERESGTRKLEEAVAAYREALKECTRERVPLQWARIQSNLAPALMRLGERERGTGKLEEAVAAYREALKEWTRERVPLQWARNQSNLGAALTRLGQRESGIGKLEEAVASYRDALKEYTRERAPLDWAATLANLGVALTMLGERESGTEKLEEAVAAYREALKERTRERVPLDWALTQNNLGNALSALGQRESGTEKLEEAVAAYREALKERPRERVPLDWATTHNNLGTALATLGELESGTGKLEEAVAAYREALKERPRERVPLDWATTHNNLGNALTMLGERESGTGKLEEAVAAYREALKEWTRERVPLDWATTQNNLGTALARLGGRESGTGKLDEAVAAYREALKERARERVPLQWATTQQNLGNALAKLGERENGTGKLEEAVAAYREALKEWTREADPDRHDNLQQKIAWCVASLEQRRKM